MNNEKSSLFKFRFDPSSETTTIIGNEKNVLMRICRSLYDHTFKIGLFFIVTLIHCISYVCFPLLLGEIIDKYAQSILKYLIGAGNGDFLSEISGDLIIAVIVFLLTAATSILQGFLISGIITDYSHSMRDAITSKFNKLSVRYIDSSDNQKLLSLFTDSVDSVNQSLNIIFLQIIPSVLLSVAIIITQFATTPLIGFISLFLCLLGCVCNFATNKKTLKKVKSQQEATNEIFNSVSEFYEGLSVLQYSGALDERAAYISERINESGAKSEKMPAAFFVKETLTQTSTAAGVSATIIAGIFSMITDSFSIGGLQRQLIYTRKLFGSFSSLLLLPGVLRTLLESSQEIFDFLDISEKENLSVDNTAIDYSSTPIEFKNVFFSYNKSKPDLLKNISFKISDRGITAITGVTGIGKTTLIKLILGFYQPTKGDVCFFGKSINSIPQPEYLSNFSVIVQGAELFKDTIANNILYGSEKATREDVINAAKLCGAHEFIMNSEKGYDTLYDGNNLSEGEIQLIFLARAFLHKKKFIIFDEATSAIDINAEQTVIEALERLSEDHGIIIISHRGTTYKNATEYINL